MATDLKVTTEQVQGKDSVMIMHLTGWLDKKSEEQFFDNALKAFEQGARSLILDMTEVDTLTSAGMRALTKVYKLFTPESRQYKDKDTHVKIYGAPEHISHVLNITGFLKYIPTYENKQAAVGADKE